MIERILNKYFRKKLEELITDHILRHYLIDIKYNETKYFVDILVKKKEYAEYTSVGMFATGEELMYLCSQNEWKDRLTENVECYLKEVK